MTRITDLIQDHNIHIKAGLNGNWYVFCLDYYKLIPICNKINKSEKSIYFNNTHKCYAIRIRSKKHINL
jgi:hypothetical protein